jgi:hypothetical protein
MRLGRSITVMSRHLRGKGSRRQRIVVLSVAVVLVGGSVLAIFIGQSRHGTTLRSANPTYAVPDRFASNCSVDVSSTLTRWIRTVPNQSRISFRAHGCYRLDESIIVNDRKSLTFVGNGAKFERLDLSPRGLTYPNANPYWDVKDSSQISMIDITVIGPNVSPDTHSTTYAFESAFAFYGVNGIKLSNLSANTVGGDGLTLGGEHASRCDRNVQVNDLMVNNVGRQGVALVCVDGGKFDRVTLNHPAGLAAGMATGFDLEPNGITSSVRNVEIKNSRVSARIIAFSAGGARDVSNIYIHDNTVISQDRVRPWLSVVHGTASPARHDWRIVSNSVDIKLAGPALVFSKVNDIVIENNTSPVARGQAGVMLTDDEGSITIADNRFGNGVTPWSATNSASPKGST